MHKTMGAFGWGRSVVTRVPWLLAWFYSWPYKLQQPRRFVQSMNPQQVFYHNFINEMRRQNMKFLQNVNMMPGLDLLTFKGGLSLANLPYMPKAFAIPRDAKHLEEYAKQKPGSRFMVKGTEHRGMR